MSGLCENDPELLAEARETKDLAAAAISWRGFTAASQLLRQRGCLKRARWVLLAGAGFTGRELCYLEVWLPQPAEKGITQ